MSSKMWLIKNGLVARKLTILDVLSPTMVPHKTKYVPILDKHVVAKVFDEVGVCILYERLKWAFVLHMLSRCRFIFIPKFKLFLNTHGPMTSK